MNRGADLRVRPFFISSTRRHAATSSRKPTRDSCGFCHFGLRSSELVEGRAAFASPAPPASPTHAATGEPAPGCAYRPCRSPARTPSRTPGRTYNGTRASWTFCLGSSRTARRREAWSTRAPRTSGSTPARARVGLALHENVHGPRARGRAEGGALSCTACHFGGRDFTQLGYGCSDPARLPPDPVRTGVVAEQGRGSSRGPRPAIFAPGLRREATASRPSRTAPRREDGEEAGDSRAAAASAPAAARRIRRRTGQRRASQRVDRADAR